MNQHSKLIVNIASMGLSLLIWVFSHPAMQNLAILWLINKLRPVAEFLDKQPKNSFVTYLFLTISSVLVTIANAYADGQLTANLNLLANTLQTLFASIFAASTPGFLGPPHDGSEPTKRVPVQSADSA